MNFCTWSTFRILVLACLPSILGACDKGGTSQNRPVEKVSIVASVFPLADVAKAVGGDTVEVSWVVESGEAVEGINPGSEARSRLRMANLLFAGGATEPWAVAGASDAFQHNRVIRLDSLNLQTNQSVDAGYLWLDPLVVCDGCRELCARLQVLRPEKEDALRASTEAYINQLTTLTRTYQQKLNDAQNQKVLVLGNEFNPLLRRCGLTPVFTVAKAPTRLNDSDVRTIRQLAMENKTHLLAVSSDTPNIVVRDIELRAAVQIVLIDALGSSGAKGRSTYIDLLRYDFEQLLHATSVR